MRAIADSSSTRRRRRHRRFPSTTAANRASALSSSQRQYSSGQSALLMAVLCGFGLVFVTVVYWLVSVPSSSRQDQSSRYYLRPASDSKKEPSQQHHAKSLVHIVHTRFMQEQGKLVFLARARLELFKSICLPTLIDQSTSDFLWIIKTDPQLHVSIRDELVALLKPHPHFFLVGSHTNFQAGEAEGSWRGGEEGHEVLKGQLYTGDLQLLQHAYDIRNDVPVLETRLDADDGLQQEWIRTVQEQALTEFQTLGESTIPKQWMYWCVQRHLVWYSSSASTEDVILPEEGILNLVQHSKLCVTPGLTVGYNVGTTHVPKYPHDTLYKSVVRDGGCSVNDDAKCIRLLDDPTIGAVRSRTPTSAGMMDALWNSTRKQLPSHQDELWRVLTETFGLSKEASRQTAEYIQANLLEIAKDNLAGQCTKGHSCKESSAELLKKLVREVKGQ